MDARAQERATYDVSENSPCGCLTGQGTACRCALSATLAMYTMGMVLDWTIHISSEDANLLSPRGWGHPLR